MDTLPKALYSAEQVRAMDRAAIEGHGVPGYRLMQRAGRAALEEALRRWPQTVEITVICGTGNNAGDGYVVAREALERGMAATLYAVVPAAKLRGDAAKAAADFVSAGGDIGLWKEPPPVPDGGLVFDGLLGTGLDRPLEGDFAAAVDWINTQPQPVVALDIPTGLHADSGETLGRAVEADLTVTFVAPKQGLLLGRGPDYVGELSFDGLGVPAEVYSDHDPALQRMTLASLSRALPPRVPTSHKGSHGSLLLVGGGPGMPGAVTLAAEAALRAGAGLVRVATWPGNQAAVVAARPEIICHGVETPGELQPLLAASDVVAVGPGLGQTHWSRSLLEPVLTYSLPAIVDADALNLIAASPLERDDWVITPHPGEAGRLLGIDTAAVQQHRLGAVQRLAQRFGAVSVLKGAGTLVATPGEGSVQICSRGNPGMASAGMGDVLTGIIGGLAVQLRDLSAAASLGVLIHALAGDDAARSGQRGTLARDLMPFLRQWVNP